MKPLPSALFLALSATLLSATTASAQFGCFGPDGLDDPNCCAPVSLDIPAQPPFTLPSSGFCWSNCANVVQSCVEISVGPGLPTTQCSQFLRDMEVLDCAGNALMKGELVLDYTRTWEERLQPGAPPQYQVWRFVAKVDLTADFTSTPPCPVPPSLVSTALNPNPTAFYYGYYDLALNCQTNAFEHSLVLFHGCDQFQHQPGISSNPGVFNPSTTYSLVGPDTPLNPFVPSAFPTPGGFTMTEGFRITDSSVPGACVAEERITQGIVAPIGSGCLCPFTFTTPQQTVSQVDIGGSCGSSVQSINAFPVAPWIEMVSTSLGSWTTGASYPGPERVAVAEGAFLYREVCGAAGVVELSLDVFYGGQTFGGFFSPTTGPVAGTGQNFLDLASNYSSPLPGPIALPLVGNVGPTDHLVYTNY